MEYVHQESWWTQNGRTNLETILCWGANRGMPFPALVDRARAWKQDGPTTKPNRLNGIAPAAAWSLVLRLLRTNGWKMPPEGWHSNPEVHRACEAGLEAVGGTYEVSQSLERDLPHIGRRFAAAFGEAYHGA